MNANAFIQRYVFSFTLIALTLLFLLFIQLPIIESRITPLAIPEGGDKVIAHETPEDCITKQLNEFGLSDSVIIFPEIPRSNEENSAWLSRQRAANSKLFVSYRNVSH